MAAWLDEHFDGEHPPWKTICQEVFRYAPTNANSLRLKRSYDEWMKESDGGRLTGFASGAETKKQRRRQGQEPEAPARHKGDWIQFELLQWFVDEIESLKSRADSRLMLDHARWLRAQVVESGVPEASLPKRDKAWLFRWRKKHGISIRNGTTTFQVSWTKARDRVRCMLGNMFRLRRLWELCHPGVAMRWLSADQKPSWMNNAGRRPMYARKGARAVGAKENHAATRDRYTILTFVPSWASADGSPPPVAVLFRAKSGVRLAAGLECPDWMKLQFQERGSYRTGDVVEAL